MTTRAIYKGRITIGNRTIVALTCYHCGLILGRKHYQKKNTTWSRVCNSCFSKRSRAKHSETINFHESDILAQNKTLETATSKSKFYTLSELDLIVEALECEFTHAEIAVLVNRTAYGIRNAIARFGLAPGWPTREVWVITLA